MNDPISPETRGSIQEELFSGRKISAIKLYRKSTGTGLKEAKEAIEKIEAELRAASPSKFITAPAAKGCLGLVCAGFLAAAIILLRFCGN